MRSARALRSEDRRLEIMLGASCLILATACLLLAGALGARTFLSSSRTVDRDASTRDASSNESSSSAGSDFKLRDSVMQQLRSGNCCDKVTANVNDGVVTLGGEVAETVDRDAAGYLARTITGVREVRNNITVAAQPEISHAVEVHPGIAVASPTPHQAANRKKGVILGPENSQKAREAKAWIDEGETTLENGDYAHAIQYFDRALVADPGNAQALHGLRRAKAAQDAETAVLGNRN